MTDNAEQQQGQEKLGTGDYKLERYKFILQEIHTLNDNVHKYLTLFQTLATAIIGAGVGLLVGWRSLGITADVARAGMSSLLGLLVILTLFLIVSIIVGVISWFDFRNEEVDLLDQTVDKGFRKRPTFKNMWRWNETYVVLFIILIVALIAFFTTTQLIPMIK